MARMQDIKMRIVGLPKTMDPMLIIRSTPIRSKGWTAYVLTLGTFLAALYLGADAEAVRTLATGIVIGLPALIAGHGWVEGQTKPAAITAGVIPSAAPPARLSNPPSAPIRPDEVTPVQRPDASGGE